MASQLHDYLVDKWMSENSGSQKTGLWKTLKEHCQIGTALHDAYFNEKEKPFEKFLPDAFLFHEGTDGVHCGHLILFESVDSNDISDEKWHKLVNFGYSCDADSLQCDLVIDRKGSRSEYLLCELWSKEECRKEHPNFPLLSKEELGRTRKA